MRPERTILALAMLAGLAGCYPYTQASYSPPVAVQPQPLHPSDGYGGLAAGAPPPPLTMRPCTTPPLDSMIRSSERSAALTGRTTAKRAAASHHRFMTASLRKNA